MPRHARRRREFRALLLLLPALFVAVVAPVHAQALLERGNGPEPSTLDAHRCQEVACGNVLRDLYEGLVTEDARGALVPGMAERWTVSPDGRTWTFHLRGGLRWSNGEPLDAAQVVASFRRAFAPATAAPFAELFDALDNAQAVQAGTRPPEALGVAAPDARTVVFRLARSAPLPALLTLPIAFPVYLPAVQRYGAQHTRPGRLVGNGAYRLVEWTPQASLVVERNPHFHDAAHVAIPRVRFQVTEDAAAELQRFAAGDLHITEVVPPQPLASLRARFGERLRIGPYLGAFWLGFNLTRAPLGGVSTDACGGAASGSRNGSADLRAAATGAVGAAGLAPANAQGATRRAGRDGRGSITAAGARSATTRRTMPPVAPAIAAGAPSGGLPVRAGGMQPDGTSDDAGRVRLPPACFDRAHLLRRALSMAIDRDTLTRYVTGFGEAPAYGVVPPGIVGYAPARTTWAGMTQPQREAHARALYRAAGYSPAHPLEIELRYNTSTPHRRLALAVAAMWRQVLGARVRLRNEEWKVFVGNRRQRVVTQVFRGGWIADVPDARNFLAPFGSDGPLNWTGYDDAAFRERLARADAAPSERARNAWLHAAETRLVGADAVIPLYFYTSKHLVDPRVRGFEANLLDRHASRWMRLDP